MDNRFEKIWNDFSSQLYNYIKSKVNDEYDSEDILQDVFVKIYNNMDKLDSSSNIKSFIYRITQNTIIDYYRKKKDLSTDIEDIEKALGFENDSTNMNDTISKCLEKLILDLPTKYKLPIHLHDIEEVKHKDISKELDISLSCSKMRVNRARTLLKDKLLNCCDFELDAFGNVVDFKRKNSICTICDDNCN